MKNTGGIDYKNMKKVSRLFHSHLDLLMEKWPSILHYLSFDKNIQTIHSQLINNTFINS